MTNHRPEFCSRTSDRADTWEAEPVIQKGVGGYELRIRRLCHWIISLIYKISSFDSTENLATFFC